MNEAIVGIAACYGIGSAVEAIMKEDCDFMAIIEAIPRNCERYWNKMALLYVAHVESCKGLADEKVEEFYATKWIDLKSRFLDDEYIHFIFAIMTIQRRSDSTNCPLISEGRTHDINYKDSLIVFVSNREVDLLSEISIISQLTIIHSKSSLPSCLRIRCKVFPFMINLLREELKNISQRLKIDSFLLDQSNFDCAKKLAVFDMDSTLIKEETIDEIGREVGKSLEISEITKRAMNGEIDFEQALRQRVALLQGISSDIWNKLKERITFNQNVQETIEFLKEQNVKIAVVSGGFLPIAEHVKKVLHLDFSFANQIEESEGKLTGDLIGKIIDAHEKANIVRSLAESLSIPLNEIIAVGDGANDIEMLSTAGLGVAYHAKEKVKQVIPVQVNFTEMDTIKYLTNFIPL